MSFAPSPRQVELFQKAPAGPLVLFYEFSCAVAADADKSRAALAEVARRHGGRFSWAAAEEETLAGKIPRFQQAAALHFRSRDAAEAFFGGVEHGSALARCTALQVAALGEQPGIVALMSAVLARIMPHWPFDNTLETDEEPGVGTSTVMPTHAAIAAVRGHPEQNTPVVMINWLKFKPLASYPAGTPAVSGRTAYRRYGKVALTTTHSLGAKLIFASRFRQILIGNDGDPGLGLWDEFALMQYPGRATFGRMAQLRRYRRGLADRAAGLAEYGQGLTVSRPQPEFTWRG